MPSWQPNWQDVVFDHDAAEAAASALDRAASVLRVAYDTSSTEDRRRCVQWTGGRRRSFVSDLDRSCASAAHDIEALRFEAARIRVAAADAREEQCRREISREAWRREAAAEEAARQEALRQQAAQQQEVDWQVESARVAEEARRAERQRADAGQPA